MLDNNQKNTNMVNLFYKHRLYPQWQQMKQRCFNAKNKDYKHYGNKNITISNEWLLFENFIQDMYSTYQEGLTLDRIDNNKGYSKENCRWVSQSIQARNTRRIRSTNTSGYRGVWFDKKGQKWRSEIRINYKKISLGSFNTPFEAAKAYDKYVIDNNLEHTTNETYKVIEIEKEIK